MTTEDIVKLRDLGESSKVQFKERLDDTYKIGCEMVAFSNSKGGQLLIGINDKTGAINSLSFTELQQTTNLLSNMASENVVPSILIEIETVAVDNGGVIVVSIPEGKNKPYHDNKGIVWVKNGADKRKVFDNSELAEMMSDSGNFSPDSTAVHGASITDLDDEAIKLYLLKRFEMA